MQGIMKAQAVQPLPSWPLSYRQLQSSQYLLLSVTDRYILDILYY
jgi:hypothetical protein